jgi:prepilin-type N-terminal cleavage/methylation domain-containing protein
MARIWGSRRGFTTIEVVAVLIIVGVIAAVIVSKLTGSASMYSVRSVAEELKGHLRYAQTRSMNSNVIWGVYFINNTQYTIFRNGNIASSNWGAAPGGEVSLCSGYPCVNIRGTNKPPDITLGNLGTSIVSFDDWGHPCTDAGAITAQSGTRSITVTSGGQTVTIQIYQNTGYIP